MANNNSIGKVFESEIKASFPADFYIERYKDDTAGFYGVSNPADYRLYKYPYTFLLELKTHKGKSLPLVKIRNSQLKGMRKAIPHRGVYCGFFINYRDLEETYYITFEDLVRDYFVVNGKGDFEIKPDGRKSVPVEWCRENGVKIEQVKKRVRYSYDLGSWLESYYPNTGGVSIESLVDAVMIEKGADIDSIVARILKKIGGVKSGSK